MTPRKPTDSADDGPDPERMTPRRLAAAIHRAAEDLGRIRLRLRSLAPYLAGARRLRDVVDDVESAEGLAVDLAADVRVGRVELAADLVDGASVPERPLLDRIEANGIDRRLSDADRARVVERGDADPEWTEVVPVAKCRNCGRENPPGHGHAYWSDPELCQACRPDDAPPEPAEPLAVGNGKARRAPQRAYDVFHGGVFLGQMKAPTLGEARRLAPAAYAGQEGRDGTGVAGPIDPSRLEVRPTPRTPLGRDRMYAATNGRKKGGGT